MQGQSTGSGEEVFGPWAQWEWKWEWEWEWQVSVRISTRLALRPSGSVGSRSSGKPHCLISRGPASTAAPSNRCFDLSRARSNQAKLPSSLLAVAVAASHPSHHTSLAHSPVPSPSNPSSIPNSSCIGISIATCAFRPSTNPHVIPALVVLRLDGVVH